MAIPESTTTPISPAQGVMFAGLTHALMRGDQGMHGYSAEQLAAVEQQAENIKNAALSGIRAAGAALAVGAHSGELEKETLTDLGWVIEMLGEIASVCDHLEANARFGLGEAPGTPG